MIQRVSYLLGLDSCVSVSGLEWRHRYDFANLWLPLPWTSCVTTPQPQTPPPPARSHRENQPAKVKQCAEMEMCSPVSTYLPTTCEPAQ